MDGGNNSSGRELNATVMISVLFSCASILCEATCM